jgi:hypothetical protein
MSSKALEWVSVSIGAPLLENMEGCSFLRTFQIEIYHAICKNALLAVSLSIGSRWGTWRGFACCDILREKGFPSWTQRTLRF